VELIRGANDTHAGIGWADKDLEVLVTYFGKYSNILKGAEKNPLKSQHIQYLSQD
jgi:hypothetical protein